jgi:hypothetical protein
MSSRSARGDTSTSLTIFLKGLFVGITTNFREMARPYEEQTPHREQAAEHTFQIKTATAMSFSLLSALCLLPLQQRRWARDLLE